MPIIASLDFETYEQDHDMVLEAGVCLFDTQSHVLSTFHFIVNEHYHRINGRYVPNNKLNFAFGSSIVLPQEVVFAEVRRLVCSAHWIVGHDVKAEKQILREWLGIEPTCFQFCDTQVEFKRRFPGHAKSNLGYALQVYGQAPHALHNAGNDAHYTMQLWRFMNGI